MGRKRRFQLRQQRTLATAWGATEGQKLALFHRKGKLIEGFPPLFRIGKGQIPYFK